MLPSLYDKLVNGIKKHEGFRDRPYFDSLGVGTIGYGTTWITEEEADIYRRGRNAKSGTMAKNASMSDYRKATGFEALMGYLYLKDDFERIVFLTKRAMELLEIVI